MNPSNNIFSLSLSPSITGMGGSFFGRPPVATERGVSRAMIGSASTVGLAAPRERIDEFSLGEVSIMSLPSRSVGPFIPENMTPEQFEAHMKTAGSAVYLRGAPQGPGGDAVEATVRYDYGYPASPWIYEYFGECGRYAQNEKKSKDPQGPLGPGGCAAWLHEPYIRRFSDLNKLAFWVAFVGLEYS